MKPVLRNGRLQLLREPLTERGNDEETDEGEEKRREARRGGGRDETRPGRVREWKDVFLGPIHVGLAVT